MCPKRTRRAKLDRLAASIPKREFEFLMKIGKQPVIELLAFIDKHEGGGEKVYGGLRPTWQRLRRKLRSPYRRG
jgi:hypothetical protein